VRRRYDRPPVGNHLLSGNHSHDHPYGHEHTTVRRLPWVTFALMGACVAAFLLTSLAARDAAGGESRPHRVLPVPEHPSIPRVRPGVRAHPLPLRSGAASFAPSSRQLASSSRTREASPQLAREQQEFDRIIGRVLRRCAVRASPFLPLRAGARRPQPHALITYQFLHGGFLHLFGTCSSCFSRGRSSRTCGAAPCSPPSTWARSLSAVMFAVRYPNLDEPLIGRLGCVAGVMGAFLVATGGPGSGSCTSFSVRPGTFTAPAWLMLPLWFARELVFRSSMGRDVPRSGEEASHTGPRLGLRVRTRRGRSDLLLAGRGRLHPRRDRGERSRCSTTRR